MHALTRREDGDRAVNGVSDAGADSARHGRPSSRPEAVRDRRSLRHAAARDGPGALACRAGSCLRPESVPGAAIEVTEGGGRAAWAGASRWPGSRCTTAAPTAPLLRSGSVGLGASYVAGWWDTDDLTALSAPCSATPPAARAPGPAGRAMPAPCSTCPARLARPGPGRGQAQHRRATTTCPTTSSPSCWTRP